MIRKVNLFFALSFEKKRLFLEAYTVLCFMRAAISLISFKRLTHSLLHSTDNITPDILTDEQIETAKLVGRMITQAANNTPWESACLVQALTAQKMLKKRNIPGVFYLGVMRDKSVKEKMKAHAWSQCGETIITGSGGHQSFAVLSVFGWDSR